MALQKQIVSIPLGRGVDNKTDDKLVSANKLLNLKNGRVGDLNVSKRFGYKELGNTVLSGGSESTLSQGKAFGGFNKELLVFNNSQAYSYSESRDLLVDKGQVLGVEVNKLDVSATENDLQCGDAAIIDNYYCVAYYDNDASEIKCKVIDQLNGSVVLTETTVEAVSSKAIRVVATSGSFYIIYFDGTNTRFREIKTSSLQTLQTAVNIAGFGSERFDALVVANGKLGVLINDASANDTKLGVYTISTASFDSVTIALDADDCVGLAFDQEDSYLYAILCGQAVFGGSTPGAVYLVYDLSLSEVVGATDVAESPSFKFKRAAPVITSQGNCTLYLEEDYSVGISSSAGVSVANDTMEFDEDWAFFTGQEVQLTGAGTAPTGLAFSTSYWLIVDGSDPSVVQFAADQALALLGTQIDITGAGSGTFTMTSQDSQVTNKIKKSTLTSAGVVTARGDAIARYHLASKPIVQDGAIYLLIDWDTELQSTSFLVVDNLASTANFNAVSKCNYDVSKGEIQTTVLPDLFRIDDDTIAVANSYKINVSVEGDDFRFQEAVNLNSFDFSLSARYFNQQLNKNLIIAGGLVKGYDGSEITELNFNQFPEDVILEGSTSGGSLADGTYGVSVVYEWTDSSGLVHQSAPSVPESRTVAGGGTSSLNVVVPFIQLTEKTGSAGEIKIVLYMTQVNGAIFYRHQTITNQKMLSFGQFAAITDQPAGTEKVLYTTGGILENLAPPPARLVATSKNRVFLVNSENKLEYWFSKVSGRNEGVSFNSVLSKKIEQTQNDIRALETMDDKVAFWKSSEIYFISGDGPNNQGINNTFTEPQLITNEVGSDNPDSVILTGRGLMFKSQTKGIWRLTRGLGIEYIGADVEAYNDETIVSANMIEDKNEVRFATSSGTQLVYDHYKNEWVVDDNIPANDAIYVNGKYHYLRSSGGLVFQEDQSFTDSAKPIKMEVETAWIKISNVQGFQRARRAAILGKFLSSHKLKVEIAYDYEEFYRHTLIWDAGTTLDSEVFGDDATFGDDDFFGGSDDGVYQVRLHLPRQKCEAIKFRITDVTEEDPGASMELTGLDLEVGVKRGVDKLRANKSI